MYVKPYWLLLILWFLPVAVQGQEVAKLTADSLQNGKSVELDKLGWQYSPNDDPRFADPQFDDRAWETLHGTAITLDSIPKSGWRRCLRQLFEESIDQFFQFFDRQHWFVHKFFVPEAQRRLAGGCAWLHHRLISAAPLAQRLV